MRDYCEVTPHWICSLQLGKLDRRILTSSDDIIKDESAIFFYALLVVYCAMIGGGGRHQIVKGEKLRQ